jgi:hypothetical protein
MALDAPRSDGSRAMLKVHKALWGWRQTTKGWIRECAGPYSGTPVPPRIASGTAEQPGHCGPAADDFAEIGRRLKELEAEKEGERQRDRENKPACPDVAAWRDLGPVLTGWVVGK